MKRLELPIDHFRLLGVSPSAEADEVLRTLQLRLDRAPNQGFTEDLLAQRSELLRLSADLLSNQELRQKYEAALLQGASGLDLSSNREVAGMLLLWEAKDSLEAFKLARKALQPPQTPALGSGREADLVRVAFESCLDAAYQEQEQRHYALASDLLQKGIKLLQRMGKLPDERKKLEENMEALLPYRILDLVSRDLADQTSHQEGINLLNDFVVKRGGIEGRHASKLIGGLKQSEFEIFFQQIRRFLTVQEQVDLYLNWYRKGSYDAGFLGAIALVASGFSTRKPERLQEARHCLKNLNKQGLDLLPLIGSIDLLLADVNKAEERFRSSSDEGLKEWLNSYSGETLAALCDYCRNWLSKDVLPGYRDVDSANIDLEAWFGDRDVQLFVENLEKKGTLSFAKAGLSFLSSRAAIPNQDKSLNDQIGENFKLADRNDSESSLEDKELSNLSEDGESYLEGTELKDLLSSFVPKLPSFSFPRIRFRGFSSPFKIGTYTFFTLFLLGTTFGLLNLQIRPSFNVFSNQKLELEANSDDEDSIRVNNLLDSKQIEKEEYTPLLSEEPNEKEVQRLIESWLEGKATILAGEKFEFLPIIASKSLVEIVNNQREKDSSAGQRQIIEARISSIQIESITKKRIAAKVTLDYRDSRVDFNNKVISETTIPSYSLTYVLGREKKQWQLVSFFGAN